MRSVQPVKRSPEWTVTSAKGSGHRTAEQILGRDFFVRRTPEVLTDTRKPDVVFAVGRR